MNGLKINRSKCQVLGINCEGDKLFRWTNLVGCEVGDFPSLYLGLLLGRNLSAISFWDVPLEKIRKRLASWKKKFFSKAGRVTLIKYVMSAFPIYKLRVMLSNMLLISVCKSMEKLTRDFL